MLMLTLISGINIGNQCQKETKEKAWKVRQVRENWEVWSSIRIKISGKDWS